MPLPASPYAVFRIREYLWFTLSRFTLTFGLQMQAAIVGWQVYKITHDALSLGLIGLAEALPCIALALPGGHVADLVSRKKIMLTTIGLLTLVSALLVYFSMGSSGIIKTYGTAPIYAMIFLVGAIRAFISPAYFSIVAQIVPRELFANASTWNSTTWQSAAVSGSAFAGISIAAIDIVNSYIIVTVFIFLSGIFTWMITDRPVPPREKAETLRESLGAGVRFVFKNQVMLSAISLDLFAVLFGGVTALLPVFSKEIIQCGTMGYGFLKAAPFFGAIISALLMAYRPPTREAGRSLLLAVCAYGVVTIFFALSRSFWLSFLLLALTGALDNVSVVVRHTILQLMTPESMRGRVSSVNMIFIGSSNEIGAFESGVAARLMGTVASVIFGGGMTVLIVGLTAKLAPKLRTLDLGKL